jgi:hypothetical protein
MAIVFGPKFVSISKSLRNRNNALVKPTQQPLKGVLFRRVG